MEAELTPQRIDGLGDDVDVGAEHDRDGVARDQPQHQEDQHRDTEQQEAEVEQAVDDVGGDRVISRGWGR